MLEAAAALVVVGAVAAAALAATAQELRWARNASATLEAAALAEDLLFRAEFLQWDSLISTSREDGGRFDGPLSRYRWRVEAIPSADTPQLLDAIVRVSWDEDRSYTVVTRFAPPDTL